MVSKLEADIVIAGHTHQVFCQKVGETWIVNPGSVYTQSGEGTTHSYGVLDLAIQVFSVFDLLREPTSEPIATYNLR